VYLSEGELSLQIYVTKKKNVFFGFVFAFLFAFGFCLGLTPQSGRQFS
jgi:hypothetical protein